MALRRHTEHGRCGIRDRSAGHDGGGGDADRPFADRAFELAVPASAAAMFVLGMLDDRLQLSPLAKLVSSLIVGALTVFVITGSLGRSLPWPVTLLAVVWFGGVVHALNLLDNMDGLAGGIALAATAFLAWLFARALGPFIVLFLVASWEASPGFFTGTGNRRDCSWAIPAACFLEEPLQRVPSLPWPPRE